MRRCPVWLLLVALSLLTACTPEVEEAGSEAPEEPGDDVSVLGTNGDDEEPDPQPEPEPEPEPCRHDRLEDAARVMLTDREPAAFSAELADLTHRCADAVVLAPADDAWVGAIAAAAAVHLDAPLLLVEPGTRDEVADHVARLEATEVLTVGLGATERPTALDDLEGPDDGPDGGPDIEVTDLTLDDQDRIALARSVADHLGLRTLIAVPEDDVRARAAALARLDGDIGLLPLPVDDTPMSQVANGLSPTVRLRVLASEDGVADGIADRMLSVGLDAVVATSPLFRTGTSTTWLVDPDDELAVPLTATAARGRGEALLPIDAADLRQGRDDTDRLRRTNPDRIVLTGDLTPEADWQVEVVLTGPELPGGGFSLFEDRRMVALYGHPEIPALGAMGEQSLDETIPRLQEVAEPYGADGLEVLPAFEMIATIASARAEETGDYSRRTSIEVLRPWVDRAAEEEIYVILDLQPGRTDFLTQAQEYEELLLEPHVGLALDPEWRLEPDQVHLQQIGSVDAEEVQEVADWLAELTREHNLPEKLLILHQFQFAMLPDRDEIEAPPELAVVVHMDGQGPQGAKDETYGAITAGAEDRWLWGWKNFYDEDDPTAEPEKVLGLEPLPVFVSYQ